MDLVREPIPKLIRHIAMPASVGFFFSTMYNVVDTYFAGLISTNALAALSLSFPVFFMIIAFGSGVAQGATALIANALGSHGDLLAHRYHLQSLSFGVMLGLLLTLLGFLSVPSLFRFLGATDAYLGVTLRYMNTILLGTVFFLSQFILNATLNAQGDTRTFRNLLVAGFALNIVLDPWFLFGGWGLPPMGIRGIALATVIIQAFGCVYLWIRVSRSKAWKGFDWNDLVPCLPLYRDIARQGLPASLNMMTVALGIFVITWFLSQFNRESVAAYGIATRVEQIVLLPTIGLNIAVLSLVGQNNGAGRLDRVREAWRTSMKYGFVLMLSGGLMVYLFALPLMDFFSSDAKVIRTGAQYLRIASLTLCSYVILFQTVFMLQGLKRPMYGIWIGLYRQIIAPCLVFYLLAFELDWRIQGIWWGIFLVTWSAAIITFFYGRWKLESLQGMTGSRARSTG